MENDIGRQYVSNYCPKLKKLNPSPPNHVFRCHAIEGCLVEPDVERKVKSAWVGGF